MTAPAREETMPTNPFPGPEPFKETDPIFGRDREIAELIDRLIADRLVLLYSPSGAGKSSMLNAAGGVLPKMRARGYHTHNTIRVGLEAPADVNRYVWSCATSLRVTLKAGQRLTEVLGEPGDDLFVFDQFEEVLTADPGDRAGRLEFFKQLGEALRVHGRWAVFAIREDYLAPVDEYLEWLPTQLASRMRINILAAKEARKAILLPMKQSNASVSFEDGALDVLLTDLAPDGWVEPVQLQVVCKDLWEELGKQSLSVITKQLLSTSGSAELALEKYYNTVVRDVAAGEVAGKLGVGERAIRDWFGSSLISESNTRLQVIKGDLKTGTLPTKVVDELEHAHLVRSDTRRNTWCELTHDRLIRPVTRSNITWKEAHLSVLQRETELWIIGGSSPDRLLRGTSYRESVRWARRHPAEVTPKEKEYLTRSRRAARRSRLLIAAAVAVLAIIMQAYFTAERAQQQSHLAAVRADAQDAIQVAADQPALAAEYALQAEHRHMEGRSLAGRLFDLATGNETIAAEQETLRGAFLAATVQHDPRYVGLIPYVHRLQDPTCVWFSADGKQIWAYTFVGGPVATANRPAGRTQAQAFDDDTLEPAANPQAASTGCPTQGFDQPGSVRFSGPAGWSVFKQPDRIEFDAPKGHKPSAYVGSPASTLVAAVVDPTGRRGAWITGRDNYVFVLDFESGQVTSLPAGDLRATSLQFSPDGNILAAGATDYLVRLWWFQAGRTAWEAPEADSPLRAHTDTVVSLGFSPDGRQLASQGLDGQIVVWRTQPVLAPVADSSPEAVVPGVRMAEVDRDNKLIVQAVANEQRVGPVKRFEVGDISDIYLRRDGRSAAIVHGSDRSSWEVVNLETGGSTGPSDRQTQIVNIALSDDGKLAALCTPAGEVNLYSLEGGKLQFEYDLGKAWREFEGKRGHIADHPLGVRSLAFLPDGRTLATGDSFHAIRFWSLEQRGESREKSVPLRNTPTALAITADGSMGASLDEMNMVRFWDLDPTSHRILGGSLQLPGSSQAFIVNHDVTIQLPGNPRGIVFGLDSKSFHALFHEGRRLSWKIDMARMREEACKLVEDPQKHAQYCGTAK